MIVKGICHVVHTMANCPLERFTVDRGPLDSLTSAPDRSTPFKDRFFLKLVGDEESCQFRALNFIIGVLGARGVAMPECCHPTWGDAKRAIKAAGLSPMLVKLTFLANFGHGPYLSGTSNVTLKTAAKALMERATPQFFEDLLAQIAFDREDPDIELRGFSESDWLESPIIAKSTPFATWLKQYLKILCPLPSHRGLRPTPHKA